ncbi:uncharacterized protein LOC119835126 [Zerene cesonia]|uniref:uncharacterized protein LOC119835126 n=1 Tax=Zerene cesonia TaxID=33412 RepID=UPI0018E5970A|nr:uncharacterized protein LOC119835126 [Zerene cesonia]
MALKIEQKTNIDSEPCVVTLKSNKLFIGTENGSIECLNADLSPSAKWLAHDVQLFAIAASDKHVYSTSNDGTIRVWTFNGDKVVEIATVGTDIGALYILNDKQLYAGDEGGNIFVYEDHILIASYNVLEEVKDVIVNPPYMFTARDLYVTVTEIKPDESKDRFVTRHVMEGRAPLRIISGSHLLAIARGGNSLQLHELSMDSKFKKIHEVKVSDMILTSLSTYGDVAWTGGWDGVVRRWKISGNKIEAAGEVNLGACINGLAAFSSESAYAIVTGGLIVKLNSA